MKIFSSNLLRRGFQDFLYIYYGAVFFVYSTAIIIALWKLPTLLLRFSPADIIGFFSYELTFSLFESLVAALFTLALAYLLPLKSINGQRAEAGGLFIISFTISSLLFKIRRVLLYWVLILFPIFASHSQQIVIFLWLFSLFSLPIVSMGLIKIDRVSRWVRSFLENSSVLAAIYTGLSLVGILIVIFRNIV